jgi:hypothetical protein
MDKADLHRLIDTLPEGSLEHAQRVLEHLQVAPPQMSPEMQRMREIGRENFEKMKRSMKPGTMGGAGGGGSFNPTTGYGHSGHTRWEDNTAVHETHPFFQGHEIAVTERIRFTDDGTAILYVHEVKGPKGDPVVNEVKFDV